MPCERKHIEAIRKAVEGYVPTKPCPVCDDFCNLNKLISAALSAADERDKEIERAREALLAIKQMIRGGTKWRESDILALIDAYFNPAKEG